jgi:hypothetical protein
MPLSPSAFSEALMNSGIPDVDPQDTPVLRQAMGIDYMPVHRNMKGAILDIDMLGADIEDVFKQYEALDPVVLKEGEKVVAHLNMAAVATLLMRKFPEIANRDAIIEWAGRSDLVWCKKGAHFTFDLPCKTHGA